MLITASSYRDRKGSIIGDVGSPKCRALSCRVGGNFHRLQLGGKFLDFFFFFFSFLTTCFGVRCVLHCSLHRTLPSQAPKKTDDQRPRSTTRLVGQCASRISRALLYIPPSSNFIFIFKKNEWYSTSLKCISNIEYHYSRGRGVGENLTTLNKNNNDDDNDDVDSNDSTRRALHKRTPFMAIDKLEGRRSLEMKWKKRVGTISNQRIMFVIICEEYDFL